MDFFLNERVQQFLEITIGLKTYLFECLMYDVILMRIYVLLNNDVLCVIYNKLITITTSVSKEQTTVISDVDGYRTIIKTIQHFCTSKKY